jgi:hypothetical protein
MRMRIERNTLCEKVSPWSEKLYVACCGPKKEDRVKRNWWERIRMKKDWAFYIAIQELILAFIIGIAYQGKDIVFRFIIVCIVA